MYAFFQIWGVCSHYFFKYFFLHYSLSFPDVLMTQLEIFWYFPIGHRGSVHYFFIILFCLFFSLIYLQVHWFFPLLFYSAPEHIHLVNSLFQSKICYGLISSSSFNFRTEGECHLSISFVFTFTSRSVGIIAALKSLIIATSGSSQHWHLSLFL